MSARTAGIWRIVAWGWELYLQDGSFLWEVNLCWHLQKAQPIIVWTSVEYYTTVSYWGSWLPLDQVIQGAEGGGHSVFYVQIFGSHTPLFMWYPVCYIGRPYLLEEGITQGYRHQEVHASLRPDILEGGYHSVKRIDLIPSSPKADCSLLSPSNPSLVCWFMVYQRAGSEHWFLGMLEISK